MRRLILVLAVLGLCGEVVQAKTNTYFVQLIVGTNREKPPDGGKRIGPKLKMELSPVFQWREYWEVSRNKIDVVADKRSRIRLTEARELEIQHFSEDRRILRLFRDGKVVRKVKDSMSARRLIMGGDSNKDEAWFVVIRRDEPSSEGYLSRPKSF